MILLIDILGIDCNLKKWDGVVDLEHLTQVGVNGKCFISNYRLQVPVGLKILTCHC